MKDTSIKTENLLHELYKSKSGEERLTMGCSMFDFSKEIVISSIKNKNPDISNKDLKIEIFNRFYQNDFDPSTLKKIENHLRNYSKDISSA